MQDRQLTLESLLELQHHVLPLMRMQQPPAVGNHLGHRNPSAADLDFILVDRHHNLRCALTSTQLHDVDGARGRVCRLKSVRAVMGGKGAGVVTASVQRAGKAEACRYGTFLWISSALVEGKKASIWKRTFTSPLACSSSPSRGSRMAAWNKNSGSTSNGGGGGGGGLKSDKSLNEFLKVPCTHPSEELHFPDATDLVQPPSCRGAHAPASHKERHASLRRSNRLRNVRNPKRHAEGRVARGGGKMNRCARGESRREGGGRRDDGISRY